MAALPPPRPGGRLRGTADTVDLGGVELPGDPLPRAAGEGPRPLLLPARRRRPGHRAPLHRVLGAVLLLAALPPTVHITGNFRIVRCS